MKTGILLIVGWIVLVSAALARGQATLAARSGYGSGPAVIVELSGEIDDFNRDQFERRVEKARELGAKTVIVDLDTYGGLVTAGLDISRFIKRQTDLHTVAFIEDKAISAGAMIAMSCDEIVVSPSATLGDCAPIVFDFDGKLEDLPAAERAKQESPILADFEESADRNHHDKLLAQAMVAVEISVYWVQSPTGEKKFVDKDEYAALKKAGWIDVPDAPVPVDSSETLLTVDSRHAVLYGLATGEAQNAHALAADRGLSVAADFRTTEGDKVVEILGSAPVRLLLIIIFLSCANIIFHAPGHGVAEVLGLVALLFMLGVPMLTGYAQWWEILIIFLGLAMVAFEILLPGHFVPGIVGAVLVLLGLIMTFVPKEPTGTPYIPHMNGTWTSLQQGVEIVAAGMVITFLIWLVFNRFLPKAPYFRRLILTQTSGGTIAGTMGSGEVDSTLPPVGALGQAVSELKPGGSAQFVDPQTSERRVMAVVSDSGFVERGSSIVVREVAGNRIVVRVAT